MASRSTTQPKSNRSSPLIFSKSPPSSSTTASSKLVVEASAESPKSLFGSNYSVEGAKENVTVTVRFRPLSQREIKAGEEIAWYADGETIVRSEHNPLLAYAYDRVFGPTTTTRHVYDIAAQHVVSGAMEGVNGTIFAYGVTSSGKTHTMHGDQRSPGVIPLAVKDAFSIIQETPRREFLLRVSYLEIYNEVVNDLLNPAGQNLRVREDLQGTFVEGIKEEVVLSPAHALSLIAAGEEHRHVGSNNINSLSSRSHTIFTMTIESSPCDECSEGEAVNLSQLHLIDLAGSESSRAETTGVRRKEGAYINKSLLTLGTVIGKLTDGKATHIPYRDSKLTRILQSSLSGQGRVSLICTVTPSSSNSEETHNTLKFAHRAKQIEIQASQNKIIDEKSLIKKYQYEIRSLKEELEQLKQGIVTVSPLKDIGEEDIILLKQKLEDGHVKLQSRLEQEEEAKAALLGRIQRLTKLILVSTKTTQSPKFSQRPGPRRWHSFGEEELAYLPHRRRDMTLDNESSDFSGSVEGYSETADDGLKEEKKNRKSGLLNWFKLRKRDGSITSLTTSDCDKSSATKSLTAPSTPQAESVNLLAEAKFSNFNNAENVCVDSPSGPCHNGEAPSNISLQDTSLTSMKTIDHVDLLREQVKILSGEVALHFSILKRLTDEAAKSPNKEHIQLEIGKVKDEIKMKNLQIASLKKQMADSISVAQTDNLGVTLSYDELLDQLNEKSFELEVTTADNRVLQDQLQQKNLECEKLHELVASLKLQLSTPVQTCLSRERPPSLNELSQQAHMESEIEELKLKLTKVTESKSQLEVQNQKLIEESAYAKGLAAAAGVELRALSEEVTKLMKDKEKLVTELSSLRSSNSQRRPVSSGPRTNIRRESQTVNKKKDRELLLENALKEKEQRECELLKKVEESEKKEAILENELSSMWQLVAKLKKTSEMEAHRGLEDDHS